MEIISLPTVHVFLRLADLWITGDRLLLTLSATSRARGYIRFDNFTYNGILLMAVAMWRIRSIKGVLIVNADGS